MTSQAEVIDIRSAAFRELARRADDAERQLAEQPSTPSIKSGPEIGSTGLEVFGGIISGDLADHHTDWQGERLYRTVDRMRRGDATCAATFLSIVLPILAAKVTVEAREGPDGAQPDSGVKEAAEFIHDNLMSGEMLNVSWQSLLREACLYMGYGHYLFEKVFFEITSGRWAGKVGWRKFAPRHPSTIQEWLFDRNGGLTGVMQELRRPEGMSEEQNVKIPIDKLVLFTHQMEAGNPLGVSIYRPAFKHWKYKDGFYAVQAIAIERQGAGVPFAKYPAGTAEPEKDKAELMLQNVQAHEQSYFTYEEDWEVGFMDMGSASVLDPMKAIEHHDLMIPKSVLASFMNLPQDSRGSFALSSDQSGFFNHSLQDAADYMASIWNQHVIPQLCIYNFGQLPSYPKLRFERIGHISVDRALEAITKAVDKGVLTPTIETENRVRDLLNLAPVDEADFEEAKEPPEVVPGEDEGGFGGEAE